MAGKHTEYHSYNIEEIENEKPKPKTPKYKNYDSDFYEELMSTPIYGSKEEWKDDYEGGVAFGKINADELPAKQREIGYVSQDIALYPQYTLFQNLAFPLQGAHAPADEIRERVFAVAELLKIRELLSRKPRELSVGQNQRAAIARALIRNPRYCFFDEPFSNVDQENANQIRSELKPLLTSRGITVLFVTHQIPEALQLADRLFVMEHGKLLQAGDPQTVVNSVNPDVHDYFAELK